jgi:hypothetical protein
MSRLFQDRTYLVYQIVKVKGTVPLPATEETDQVVEETPPDETPDQVVEETDDAATDVTETAQVALNSSEASLQTARITATVHEWITTVQKYRDAVQRRGLKVIISPRASMRGALMLSKGIDLSDVAALEVSNRMSPSDWVNLQTDTGIRIAPPRTVVRTMRKHKQTALLAKLVSLRINTWLKGPAGSGKTTAARLAAEAANLAFFFTGAIDSKYELTGFVDAQGRIVNTQYRKAYTQGGVFLFDELDASQPNALLAFNASLANGYADFPGCDEPVKAHRDFVALVGANTIGTGATAEYSGRFKQDGALCDRFSMLLWDYDLDLEREIALMCAGVA